MRRYVQSGEPADPDARAYHRRFRQITPAVLSREVQSLVAAGYTDESLRAATNRLNVYVAGDPLDEYADVEPIE